MKRLIALFLSAALLLTLLASCSVPDGNDDGKGPEGPDFVPKTYLEEVEKWAEHLEFTGKTDSHGKLAATEIENVKEEYVGFLMTEVVEENIGEDDALIDTVRTNKWYGFNGKVIRTFVSKTAEFPLKEGYAADGLVEYTFGYFIGTEFVKVTARELVLIEAEEGTDAPDPTLRASYEEKVTYSYYFGDGSTFVENLENELSYRPVSNASAALAGRYLLDSDDKTYLIERGEVIAVFELGMEYNVPVYDDGYTLGNENDYTYFVANGFNYLIHEEPVEQMMIGDLVGYRIPGVTITVMDEDFNVVNSYKSSSYSVVGYAVLDNGNVYVCEYELLSPDAAEYDILSGDEKLGVVHKLINAKDGTISELELGYTVQKLFNETTKSIKSYTGLTTLVGNGFDLYSTTVKNGYTLATINKYEGGLLDGNSVYAILDNNLAVVAELPNILPDQVFYPGMFGDDVVLVETLTVGNKMISYAVNTKTGTASLFPKNHTAVTPTSIGYLVGKTIYSEDWEEVYQFTGNYEEIFVVNGEVYALNDIGDVYKLRVVKAEYEYDNDYYELEYFSDFKGDYYNTYFTERGDLILREDNNYSVVAVFDTEMNTLFADEELYFDVYSEKLSDYVECYKTKSVSNVMETEYGYVISLLVSVERVSSTEEESGIPDSDTYYEYYVLK